MVAVEMEVVENFKIYLIELVESDGLTGYRECK